MRCGSSWGSRLTGGKIGGNCGQGKHYFHQTAGTTRRSQFLPFVLKTPLSKNPREWTNLLTTLLSDVVAPPFPPKSEPLNKLQAHGQSLPNHRSPQIPRPPHSPQRQVEEIRRHRT